MAATPAIERICAEVWNLAELSLEEFESARVHMRELEAAGFTVTSGVSGNPPPSSPNGSRGAADRQEQV